MVTGIAQNGYIKEAFAHGVGVGSDIMAKEFKSKKGYRVFDVSIEEILNWGGLGICDSCGCTSFDNILIPVLNSCYCRECFNRWNNRHDFYAEDIAYQEKVIERHKVFFKE